MCVYSVRMTDQEKELLEAYAKMHGISMSTALKAAFFEMLEDEYDIKVADEALEEFEKDPVMIDAKDIYKKYGI